MVCTQVLDKRLIDVVDQIGPTVALAIIVILVDIKYQFIDRSIVIFHFAQVGRTVLVKVSRTRVPRPWTRILV